MYTITKATELLYISKVTFNEHMVKCIEKVRKLTDNDIYI